MPGRPAYYTLIGSLPAMPAHFELAERMPISRLSLHERLKLLEPSDAASLQEMSGFLVWERQPVERTDSQVVEYYEKFMASSRHALVRQIITYGMQVRTIVAAFRARRLELDPPIGISPLTEKIARQWKAPTFGLENEYPYVTSIQQSLEGDTPADLERLGLGILWDQLARLSGEYHQGFEFVVLYLFKWEIVSRWLGRDAQQGQDRFSGLVQAALGPYQDMFSTDGTPSK